MTSPPDDRPEHHVRWATRLALAIVQALGAFEYRNDALQEAYLAMSLAWARYDPTRGNFEDFAKKRVAGAVCRAVKQQRRWRALAVVFDGDEEIGAALDGPGDPWVCATRAAREVMGAIASTYQVADAVERLDRGEAVTEELARLGPDELALVDLKYRRGLPMAEVAAGLGIKERAARYRDAQLRLKLKAALAKGGE